MQQRRGPRKFLKSTLIAAAATLAAAGPAQAGLTGDSVGTRYYGLGDTGVHLAVVGAGEEGSFFGNQFFDYTDNGFSIRSTGENCGVYGCSGETVSLELSSLDFGVPITSVSLTTNLSGVTVSHTADSITFTWGEQSLHVGTYLSATINAVPEPETYALLLAGLVGVGAAARRRRA